MAAASGPHLAQGVTIPEFSVIIPHRNDREGLARTLAALSALSVQPTFEIVIADNGSEGGGVAAAAIAADYPKLDVRTIDVPTPGAGPARNAGVTIARGDRIAFLDCDCLPDCDWLENARRCLDDEEGAVFGGPVVVSVGDQSASDLNPAQLFDLLYGFDVARSFRIDGLLLTANLLMTKETFLRVGPFVTGLSEDRDWCLRARQLGVGLKLAHKLSVRHQALSDATLLSARWRRVARETHAYHRAHGAGRSSGFRYYLFIALSPLAHGWRLIGPAAVGVSKSVRLRTLALLVQIRWSRALIGARLALGDMLTHRRSTGGFRPEPDCERAICERRCDHA